MFETFCDIATDEAANEEAASFIRRKVAEIVKDPETRRKLMPDRSTRPAVRSATPAITKPSTGPTSRWCNLKETPITDVTEKGIVLRMASCTNSTF